MAGQKTLENDQFARTSESGNKTTPYPANDLGIAPLADRHGRLFVRLAGPNGALDTFPFFFNTFLDSAGIILAILPNIILQGFSGYNDNLFPVYLQFFNDPVLPLAAAPALYSFPVDTGPNEYVNPSFKDMEITGFTLGITAAVSSTPFIFTPIPNPTNFVFGYRNVP